MGKLEEYISIYGFCPFYIRRWFNPIRWILGKRKIINPKRFFIDKTNQPISGGHNG